MLIAATSDWSPEQLHCLVEREGPEILGLKENRAARHCDQAHTIKKCKVIKNKYNMIYYII
jgi:hypothetical protein